MAEVLVIGDPDSHGGAVVSGDARTTVAGIPVATIGSAVSSDPRKGHSGKTIVGSGSSGKTTAGDKAIAVSGASVSCGASVSATHSKTTAL